MAKDVLNKKSVFDPIADAIEKDTYNPPNHNKSRFYLYFAASLLGSGDIYYQLSSSQIDIWFGLEVVFTLYVIHIAQKIYRSMRTQ